MFFYADGQEIHKDDIVAVAWGDLGIVGGTIIGVFSPGTEDARNYHCLETGGVLIEESAVKRAFGLLCTIPVNGMLSEDYELISRSPE